MNMNLENILQEIAKEENSWKDLTKIKREIIRDESRILRLIAIRNYVYRVEKYTKGISDHLFYNESTKSYMKIFDVREMSIWNIVSGIALAHSARNTIMPGNSSYVENLMEMYERNSIMELKSQKSWSDTILKLIHQDTLRYSNESEKMCKHIIIVQWNFNHLDKKYKDSQITGDYSHFKNAVICIGVKTIREELMEQATKDNLVNSLFSDKSWKTIKHPKSLKYPFKLIKNVLDESYDYKVSRDFLHKFIQSQMVEYFNKISKTRDSSSKFGL